MKTFQTGTAAALLIVVGGMIPAFGQGRSNWQGGGREFHQRDAQPQVQQQQQQQQQPQRDFSRRQRQDFRQRDAQPQSQQQRPQNNWQRPQNNSQRQQNFAQPQYQPQYRPQNNYRDHGSSYNFAPRGPERWSDRGGYRGRFIPQARFNSYFGRQHFFRIGRPLYDNGFARFSYGGYGFQILDPVPAYWGPDWYDSDDVYVDYDNDGYYLYNRSYPGVGIALNIEF
jgi:hypothetical protein